MSAFGTLIALHEFRGNCINSFSSGNILCNDFATTDITDYREKNNTELHGSVALSTFHDFLGKKLVSHAGDGDVALHTKCSHTGAFVKGVGELKICFLS